MATRMQPGTWNKRQQSPINFPVRDPMLKLKFTDPGPGARAQHSHLSPLWWRGLTLVKLKNF